MIATAQHTCGCANGAASTCLATDCVGSRMLEYVQVNTTAGVDPIFFYPGLRRFFVFRGQAIVRVGQ